ncbi:3D domain-containing protein [Endozoicomonas sp. G2_2]|nr:3D domain-containing protein [Endozoicomonas sp. G2_2]MBO9470702.1 3D domain-containing protein [Endozoicomonas sp. G2_2]
MRRFVTTTISVLSLLCASVSLAHADPVEWKELNVSATAYNSVPWQTTAKKPAIAAWGDELKPGMRAIAVSRDLIEQGLTHGARVKIEGMPGVYVVRDKMNRRWRKKIDIYMGKDVAAAREFGIQHDIRISWAEPDS